MTERQKLKHVDAAVDVGRRLKEARERAGLSQRQLSFPGCTAAYISRIESGERIPSLQILREFARRLGVSEAFLAYGRDDAAPADPLLEGEVALRLDDLTLARRLFSTAEVDAIDDRTRARARAGLGQIAFRRGDQAKAIALLADARELDPDLELADPSVADTLGRAYAMAGEYESALGVLTRALSAAKERRDRLDIVRFSVLLANTWIDSGDFAHAETVLSDVLADLREIKDPLARARLFWSQSRLHALRQDSEAAARYARRALETLQVSEYTYYAAYAHQTLAHIELDRGNAEDALELLEAGLPLVRESGNKLEEAQFKLEEARALAKLGRAEAAASLAMEVAPMLRKSSPLDAGRSYNLIAEVFAETGDDARAIELYELAIEMLERSPTRYLVEAYSRLAELLERTGRKDDALALLKRAMRVQTDVGRQLTAHVT
jgi:tetratricopeptide (TPR) repeat protein